LRSEGPQNDPGPTRQRPAGLDAALFGSARD